MITTLISTDICLHGYVLNPFNSEIAETSRIAEIDRYTVAVSYRWMRTAISSVKKD